MGRCAEDCSWFRFGNSDAAKKMKVKVESPCHASTGQTTDNLTKKVPEGSCADAQQCRAFDFADIMEQGFAGTTHRFLKRPPVDDRDAPQTLHVRRSKDRRTYVLSGKNDERLLRARSNKDGTGFDIFLAGDDEVSRSLGPEFTLHTNSEKRLWTLSCVRCDECEAHSNRVVGTRSLLHLRQYQEKVGTADANCIDLRRPVSCDDGSEAVMCSVCGSPNTRWSEPILTTRRPLWKPEHGGMTLDFKGRVKVASAKNFLMQVPGAGIKTPATLLFGKVGKQDFVLDHRRAFCIVEAFATALSAAHWT